jgi:hypothetical protein
LELGTGHAKDRSRRIALDSSINTTELFVNELELDRDSTASLHLIYEYFSNPKVEPISKDVEPLPTLTGKAKGKGKTKGKGASSAKKIKLEPANKTLNKSVSLYTFIY